MAGLKLLGIETSSYTFSVAVSEGNRILKSLSVGDARRPSTLLSELIQQAITSVGWTLHELDGFTLSIGPGSFTGLRVGVMTVKTLAWALKKPVWPISSLEVLAQNLASNAELISPFVDARKGKVYTALFSPDGPTGLKRLAEDRLMPPERVLEGLPFGVVLVGDGLKRYQEQVVAKGEGKIRLAPESNWIPTAESLCRIAADRWPKGLVDDPHRLVPEYLYSQESDIAGW